MGNVQWLGNCGISFEKAINDAHRRCIPKMLAKKLDKTV